MLVAFSLSLSFPQTCDGGKCDASGVCEKAASDYYGSFTNFISRFNYADFAGTVEVGDSAPISIGMKGEKLEQEDKDIINVDAATELRPRT